MKTNKIISGVLAVTLIFTMGVSCKNSNSDSKDSNGSILFKNDLTEKTFDHYNELKTALTQGNASEAKKAGKALSETISNNYLEVSELSKEIATSENIETQRMAFSKLTEAIQPIFESNISEGEIYKQYCPMAFNNTGASWFSTSKKIENPYLEDMAKCGSIKEVIK
ncbi:DUF3347 domain-containing protein [Galbibacter sp. BG1]|uniref:DUF3347 domain-containing protein n=1 Tax=Galbibacter sp. BG1 TaxID=1170699 RepID=UPI0015C0BBF9|nr:DUF3347 domain-containing protein [Galbibacter sp. BG1]QLE02806.1 DUF3347 domain-containing protein [Galbibacter sp. BG1]